MQAIQRPRTGPLQAPYRPLKGQHHTGTACVAGPLAGHLLHILSPLVGHYTHDTQAQSSKGPPPSPKPHRPTAPNPPFQNTLVQPTTTTTPHHHHPAARTIDIPPMSPVSILQGRGRREEYLAAAYAAHRKRDLGARIAPCTALLRPAMLGEAKQQILLGRDGAR